MLVIHNATRMGLIYKTLTKLCCEYVNVQEMIKHKKITNMCLKLVLQVIILKRKIYKVASSLNNSTEFLFFLFLLDLSRNLADSVFKFVSVA